MAAATEAERRSYVEHHRRAMLLHSTAEQVFGRQLPLL